MKIYTWFLVLLALLVCGLSIACHSAEPVIMQAPTPAATLPAVEVTRQPASATPTPQLIEVTSITCAGTGVIKRYALESHLMNGTQYVTVYLPPCYDTHKAGGYPVLYLLHGRTYNDEMWLDLGAKEIADELISSGASQPFLMVMPYEEYNYRNPEKTAFADALTNEIIPFVDSTFDTCTDRTCRALGGISRGASWAVRIGLQKWNLFGSVGAHSLPTFVGDLEKLPGWLAKIPEDEAPRLYIDIGRFDPEIKAAYAFEQVLNEKGIMNEWHLNDGRHNMDYWSAHIREYMEWYARGWDNLQ
jgi:enterochelin esterase-like enzyme